MTMPWENGLAPNLIPNPPGEIPEASGAGDATAQLSPFREAQDVDSIIKNLILDRPLKLYIPHKERYPQWEFRVINSIPGEIATARNKGFREVDAPEMAGLFTDLIAGHDKANRAFRPILMARPKKVGDEVRRRQRMQLRSMYAGMDPRNKELDGRYTKNIREGKDASEGNFSGANWRIHV